MAERLPEPVTLVRPGVRAGAALPADRQPVIIAALRTPICRANGR